MSVLVVGLSHHSAPVELLERAALTPDVVGKLLEDLAGSDSADEAMVLATCNRIEVYLAVEKFHPGVADASELLARRTGVPLDALTPALYVHYEDRAVAHLFAVACGLDSMVVGESQVLGQVRTALRGAQEAGTVGRTLGTLAQQALRVGKRARTETGIDSASRSLVTTGLDEAVKAAGPLAGRTGVVVGAGAMSSLSAAALARCGISSLRVVNRTLAHAQRVAEPVGGEALPLDQLPTALRGADVVVSCTGAVGHVLSADHLAAAAADRTGDPLVVLDLALPRDVEPSARAVPGVLVLDLEHLAAALTTGQHVADVDDTRAIVAEEVAAFLSWQRSWSVAPTVVALRGMAEGIVRSELGRLASRLPELDERTNREFEQTVRRVVDKVLHTPTVRVQQLAGEPVGHSYADALRRLFDLDSAAVDAVTRPDSAAVGEESG